ncbi:MAG: putative dynein heavy chain [Streblomastix strix]|uniref:Putative dynein heavy chain n=1 Tax=Streblomastix strix TaxID=222440 RepID=A0A5J4UX38_9EUKA|nr:MAG: putative dynein heavy chain [Streblomastix strix]
MPGAAFRLVIEQDTNNWKVIERKIIAKEPSVNIGFIRVDAVPLKTELVNDCKSRQEMFEAILNNQAATTLRGIYDEIDQTIIRMDKFPKTSDELKTLDQTIKDARDQLPQMEEKLDPLRKQQDLLERCSDITPVSDQETMLFLQLLAKFQSYQRFIAQAETRIFELKVKFLATGPYADSVPLHVVQGTLEGFRNDIKAHREEGKRLLVSIELFGPEQRVYADLQFTVKNLDDLTFFWNEKRDWVLLCEQWKTGKFRDQNVMMFEDKSKQDTNDLLRMKTECENIEVWKALKANVKNFRQSLPLITNLRNEAIRERHWDKLKGEEVSLSRQLNASVAVEIYI